VIFGRRIGLIERMSGQPVKTNMVSFVVPAWNEEAVIAATLQSIHDAASRLSIPYEIVLSNDDSSDRTAEIAAANGARVTTQLRRQIAGTRNAGAKAASGDVLIFVDADTHINPRVVKATLDAIERGAVGGGCMVRFDHVPKVIRGVLVMFTWFYRKARMAAGCYVFCTRAAFEHTGGFDERFFAGEEVMLSAKLRRYGKFVLLEESVLTSARKLRTFTLREYITAICGLSIRFPFRRESRGMELWYGPRRQDPQVQK
jgi:glycosyltransferase involved in cell wall biosynthesis